MSRDDELAYQRQAAAEKGEEHAVPADGFPRCNTGAPLPHVIADGHRTTLTYLAAQRDPNWDGTYVTVKDAASGATESIVVVRFELCRATTLGPPNDEALHGHRLWGKGLDFYDAHIVINSSWIAELEERNRVHPHHSAAPFAELKHYVLTFHDETFECIARSHTAEIVTDTYPHVLHGIVDRLTERHG